MATPPIKHRRNGVTGQVPAVTDLVYGELAINYADGKLFMLQEVGGNPTVVDLLASAGGDPAWADITGKPSTFPPSAHTHAISEVTGLQTALDDSMTLSTGQTVSGVKTFEGGFTVESEKVNLGSGSVGISRTISAEHVRSTNLQFNLTGGDLELTAGAVNSSRVGNNEGRTYTGGDVKILAGNAEYAGTWGNTVTKGATIFGHRSIDRDTGAFTDVEFGRFNSAGILDTVSMPQVAGVSVVARGGNSNGEWTRFADGTQICVLNNFGAGTSVELIAWTFPASFAATPAVTAAAHRSSSDGIRGRTSLRACNSTGVGIWRIPDSPWTMTVYAMAIGRWF